MNSHGNDVFQNIERGEQHITRGGRNYRRAIEDRIPMSLPDLKPKPGKLTRTIGYPNIPFPNIPRAYTSGVRYTLR